MHMGRQQPILFAFWPKQWALEHLSISLASWSVLCQLERVRCKSQWWYSTLWLGKTWISTYQGRVKCGHDEISPRTLQRQIQRELYTTPRYHSCKEKADGFVYWASRLQKINTKTQFCEHCEGGTQNTGSEGKPKYVHEAQTGSFSVSMEMSTIFDHWLHSSKYAHNLQGQERCSHTAGAESGAGKHSKKAGGKSSVKASRCYKAI